MSEREPQGIDEQYSVALTETGEANPPYGWNTQPEQQHFARANNADADESDWRLRGLCGQMADSDNLFFPSSKKPLAERKRLEALAKEVCRQCSVTAECLSYALTTGEQGGVWGGMDEKERRGVLANRNRRRVS